MMKKLTTLLLIAITNIYVFAQNYEYWPIKDYNSNSNIIATYGENSGKSVGFFHEAIDIQGEGGTVVAVRPGVIHEIIRVDTSSDDYEKTGGMVAIKVNLGNNYFEYDCYLHVTPDENIEIYDFVDVNTITRSRRFAIGV